jgi:tRNA (guanine-N7-)-methyltransferase
LILSRSPYHPDQADWEELFPGIGDKKVEHVDIGCGYGGFLVGLGQIYPEKYSLGMEIRVKVSNYVKDRIETLRNVEKGSYNNIACLRTNAMKYLTNYFQKDQISKLFFLFPDPHFKKSKHKWRIINPSLLSEYSYVLKTGGMIYTVTDVKDLHDWMVEHLEAYPKFQRISDEEAKSDILYDNLLHSSEESKKVDRISGEKFVAIFRKV